MRERDVPYHALYDRGYKSIGCAPCTRATAPDEPSRAGRWWWETNAPEGVRDPLLDRERRARARAARAPRRMHAVSAAVACRGEAAEVARAEAQAVLAMVQDETRRGRLADVVAAVDDGEVDGADADALARAARARPRDRPDPRALRARGRAGGAGALPPAAARQGADASRRASLNEALGRARGPHDRADLGERRRTWRIRGDDLDRRTTRSCSGSAGPEPV